jgi:GGDEF domain-containing protein
MSPTRILDRKALFDDLEQAVSPESARSVLVVFGFEGLKEHLETVTTAEGDALLEQIAARLHEAVGGACRLYAPRRGEFCGLFDGGLPAVRPLLVTIPVELDEDLRSLLIRSSLSVAELPGEATDPTYALSLADRRLRALSGELRPAKRQDLEVR